MNLQGRRLRCGPRQLRPQRVPVPAGRGVLSVDLATGRPLWEAGVADVFGPSRIIRSRMAGSPISTSTPSPISCARGNSFSLSQASDGTLRVPDGRHRGELRRRHRAAGPGRFRRPRRQHFGDRRRPLSKRQSGPGGDARGPRGRQGAAAIFHRRLLAECGDLAAFGSPQPEVTSMQ